MSPTIVLLTLLQLLKQPINITSPRLHPQRRLHDSLCHDDLLHRQPNRKRAWPPLCSILLVGSRRNVGGIGRILALHRRHQLQRCGVASYTGPSKPDGRFHDAGGSGPTRESSPCSHLQELSLIGLVLMEDGIRATTTKSSGASPP